MHIVRNMLKYTSKMTTVMVNMINIDQHKDGDHEIRYEPGFNLGSDHKTVQLNCILLSQSNDSVKFSLLDPPSCLDLICSGHATVKFSFGTRLMRLMMLIIGEEVKFLTLRVLRVFKPQLPVFRTEPHVHEKLQRTFQRDNER